MHNYRMKEILVVHMIVGGTTYTQQIYYQFHVARSTHFSMEYKPVILNLIQLVKYCIGQHKILMKLNLQKNNSKYML